MAFSKSAFKAIQLVLIVGTFFLVSAAFADDIKYEGLSNEYKNNQNILTDELKSIKKNFLSEAIKAKGEAAKEAAKNGSQDAIDQANAVNTALNKEVDMIQDLGRAVKSAEDKNDEIAKVLVAGGNIDLESQADLLKLCSKYDIIHFPQTNPRADIEKRYDDAIKQMETANNALYKAALARWNANFETKDVLSDKEQGKSVTLQQQVYSSYVAASKAWGQLKHLKAIALRDYDALVAKGDNKRGEQVIENGKIQSRCKDVVERRNDAAEKLRTPPGTGNGNQ